METSIFKSCNHCNHVWPSRNRFLEDPGIELIGYQVNFNELEMGLFLFNHTCHTTFILPAIYFVDLYDGPIFEERRTLKEECPEYCFRKNELDPCPVKCECAFIREVIQIIRRWHKRLALA